MGNLQPKKMKQKEKNPANEDTKNETTKEAAGKRETDFNHGEENDFTGNLNNTANPSQGPGPTQPISHQLEPNNGNEAILTRMHQVLVVDASQISEQSIHKAVNILQDADPVKYIPYLASVVRVTQQHTSLAKHMDSKTRDVCDKLSQQQSRPSAQVLQQKKLLQHQRKKQENSQESRNSTQPQHKLAAKETKEVLVHTVRTVVPCDMDSFHNSDISASVQVLAQVQSKDTLPQVECSFGSEEPQEMAPQLPASKMQAAVHRTCKGVVSGVTTEDLRGKEAETQTKTKINKSPVQKSNCVLSHVNEANTDLTCHVKDKAHNIVELNTTTTPGIAEVPAAMPTEPPNRSRQMSGQPKAQVNNEENALNQHCLNHNNVTNIAVDYQYCFSAKSGSSHAKVAKMRRKLAKKIKAQPGDDGRSSQQTAEETVTTVQQNSQQQGCTAIEENTIKKHNEPHQIPQPNKAGKSKKKCTLKALNQNQPTNTGDVTMKKEMNGKNGQVEKEKQEPTITCAVTSELACAKGRWHPFIVNQSCACKVRCRHNPGTGLPPNVQKWFYECPNHLCEPRWITRARSQLT